MAELLRPPPHPSIGQRLGALLAGITVTRVLTTAGAILLVAVTAWWLLRSPAPPVERSLPSARSADAGVPSAAGTTAAPTVATTSAAPTDIVVQAAGAVTAPGVYHLSADARVVDVVAAAGGATAEADLQAVALAAKVTDGARVYVPRAGEAVAVADAAPPGSATSGPGPPTAQTPLDLNQATESELDALPGVGPATAQAILAYRQEHGPFLVVDDLLDVRGIGTAKLDAFRDLVRVG